MFLGWCFLLLLLVNLRNTCVFVSEDEQIAPIDLKLKEPPKINWEDEDVDENDVKESWEDEDEPAPVRTIKNDFTIGHFIRRANLSSYCLISIPFLLL